METIEGFFPASGVDQIVPFGDEILDRATAGRLAERHSTVHASSALGAQVFFGRIGVDFLVIIEPDDWQSPGYLLAVEFFESSWLSHRSKLIGKRVDLLVGWFRRLQRWTVAKRFLWLVRQGLACNRWG